ncbi:MAG: hypothetical protein HQL49_04125 [Gammaproteobacteria bacterium]|nr:hypothetical protein [Gammaproteobacteria bacterium]
MRAALLVILLLNLLLILVNFYLPATAIPVALSNLIYPSPTHRNPQGEIYLLTELSQPPLARAKSDAQMQEIAADLPLIADAVVTSISLPPSAEAQRMPETPLKPTTPIAVSAPPDTHCYRLIGRWDKTALATLRENLQQRHLTLLNEGVESLSVPRFWVYIRYDSARLREELIARLKQAAIDDYYVIRNSETTGTLSLGLFSQQASAETINRRVKAIAKLPQLPEIEATSRMVEHQWLLIHDPSAAPKLLVDFALGKGNRYESALCSLEQQQQ